MSQNMRRFRPDGPAVAGGRIAGYPWNGYPQCAQRREGPFGWKPLPPSGSYGETGWGSVLFGFWPRCSRGLRLSGHWRLSYVLPKTENACCDPHSDLLDTLSRMRLPCRDEG